MIHFYDVNNFKEVVQCCSVAPHLPGRLCTSSPSTLMYLDYSKKPCEVRWLDCSGATPNTGMNITRVPQHSGIYDICCLTHNMLIITHGYKGLCAYNTQNDKLEWSVAGNLRLMKKPIGAQGVTTDGRGHLFVCDAHNAAVQMFSVAEGKYIRALLNEGMQGFGTPRLVRWCRNTSSLVVVHITDTTKYNISKFQMSSEDLLQQEPSQEDVIVID